VSGQKTEIGKKSGNVGICYNSGMLYHNGSQAAVTGDQLAGALETLGVNFLLGERDHSESFHDEPARLIAGLAKSNEARLRLALIPLFLVHPEFAAHVRDVAKGIDEPAQTTLQCYYSAAVFLQQIHHSGLNAMIGPTDSLPDHFSHELALPLTGEPEDRLVALAKRQQQLSGEAINWLGTYQHAMQVWLRARELQNA
jgi:hypothetical protein